MSFLLFEFGGVAGGSSCMGAVYQAANEKARPQAGQKPTDGATQEIQLVAYMLRAYPCSRSCLPVAGTRLLSIAIP